MVLALRRLPVSSCKYCLFKSIQWNTRWFSGSKVTVHVVERIQDSPSSDEMWEHITNLSIPYLVNNPEVLTTAASTAHQLHDLDAAMKIYHYTLDHQLRRDHDFYEALFRSIPLGNPGDLDLVHSIIKQMTIDRVELTSDHTDSVLKLIALQSKPSISDLQSLYELFVDKLALCPSHYTFEYMMTGCCRANQLHDAMHYFETAVDEFKDIPNVETIKVLIQCIYGYSNDAVHIGDNGKVQEAVDKLETVIDRMSEIYKRYDPIQYEELMNDREIVECAINCYFNNKQYDQCVLTMDSIEKIDDNDHRFDHRLQWIYRKSCIEMMRNGENLKEEHVVNLINMKVDESDKAMMMLKLEALSWILMHKTYGVTASMEQIGESCDALMKTEELVIVDKEKREQMINADNIPRDEMRGAVALHVLSSPLNDYKVRLSLSDSNNFRSLFNATFPSGCVEVDFESQELILSCSS